MVNTGTELGRSQSDQAALWYSLISSVTVSDRRGFSVRKRHRRAGGDGGGVQAGAVFGHHAFDGLAEVPRQVESVGDLDRLASRGAAAQPTRPGLAG
jgi:hypothetical protein